MHCSLCLSPHAQTIALTYHHYKAVIMFNFVSMPFDEFRSLLFYIYLGLFQRCSCPRFNIDFSPHVSFLRFHTFVTTQPEVLRAHKAHPVPPFGI
jgi:hypothetical protein